MTDVAGVGVEHGRTEGDSAMKISWMGHACFLLVTEDGVRIVTDPFDVDAYGGAIGYPAIDFPADIVVISHAHPDHNAPDAVRGTPQLVTKLGAQTVQGTTFRGIPSYHDDTQGSQRGENTIFAMELDGRRVVHLGDLGHELTAATVEEIGAVDVLFIPVGGNFTINARLADTVIDALQPRVVIPMHYKTPALDFLIEPIDPFLAGKSNVKRPGNEVTVTRTSLPREQEIWVLDYRT